MHNARKIKKRKPKGPNFNAEELAQDKLFEISRCQCEEQEISEADIFLQKLKSQQASSHYSEPFHKRLMRQHKSLNQFLNDFQKKIKLPQTFSSFRQQRSQSSETQNKKPLTIINYMLIDKRENKLKVGFQNKLESLANIKRKFSQGRSRKKQPANCQSFDSLCSRQKVAIMLRDGNTTANVIKIKDSKAVNTSTSFQNSLKA